MRVAVRSEGGTECRQAVEAIQQAQTQVQAPAPVQIQGQVQVGVQSHAPLQGLPTANPPSSPSNRPGPSHTKMIQTPPSS
jgi:hypothetical protein